MTDARDEAKRVSRRIFLGGAAFVLVAPACSDVGAAREEAGPARPTSLGDWAIPSSTYLAPERFATLAATMDAFIPGDAASPGATIAGAAVYLDLLLGAFDVDPPRIFAGGPYSGRHGGEADFARFQPLTRVEELGWRTYLEGSHGRPERMWNGPVKGLQEIYSNGLDALDAAARDANGAPFWAMPLDARRSLLLGADKAFVDLVYGHAVEGTYGDPVYGGNVAEAGWRAIAYEGDRQPEGYTAREMAHPEEG
jgi:hypothetical protein